MTAEIDTFISDVSTTSTNIAIASRIISRRLPEPSAVGLAIRSVAHVCPPGWCVPATRSAHRAQEHADRSTGDYRTPTSATCKGSSQAGVLASGHQRASEEEPWLESRTPPTRRRSSDRPSSPIPRPPSPPPPLPASTGAAHPSRPVPAAPPGRTSAPVGWVIAAMLLFWPTGIPALLASHRAAHAFGAGAADVALRESANSRRWSIISVIVGGRPDRRVGAVGDRLGRRRRGRRPRPPRRGVRPWPGLQQPDAVRRPRPLRATGFRGVDRASLTAGRPGPPPRSVAIGARR